MPRSNQTIHYFKNQKGAALLAFMLIVIVAASFTLVSKLNQAGARSYREQGTAIALARAKEALMGYAAYYPDNPSTTDDDAGPGHLPCPDLTNNGSAAGNCSFGGGTWIGRFPRDTLDMNDIRDADGQVPWYAVSENYRYGANKLTPLNSETPGQLTLDGTDDIVAIIFAPGTPFTGQNRNSGVNDVSNYLEGENSDGDRDFVSTGTGDFNDRMVVITRRELMVAVEKRVLGELRNILRNYRALYDAYPWLTPFADPKADTGMLSGRHTGGNNSASLTDSTRDFTEWGVAVGDTVRNIDDGSIGTITAVTATTLSIGGGLSLGADNDFDSGDEYYVNVNALADTLSGIATGGNVTTLVDTGKNFSELGIAPGYIVDKIPMGPSGMVESVTSTQIIFKASAGMNFSAGDNYHVRSNIGVATGGSNGLIMEDTYRNFVDMGIRAGDLVINISDGSSGRVAVVTNTQLILEGLKFGTENDFDITEHYLISRYITDNATREGLLSFHRPGKYFKTGFSVDWNITSINGASLNTVLPATPSPNPAYIAGIESRAQTSTGTTGTVSVDYNNGQCIWLVEQAIECKGIYNDSHFPVLGTITSGTNTSILTDTNADFLATGIKRGDLVKNYDDEDPIGVSGTATAGTSSLTLEDTGKDFITLNIIPYYHIIHNTTTSVRGLITGIVDSTTLSVMGFDGRPAIVLAPGNTYTIYKPREVVVTSVTSSTQLNTTRLSAQAPDFDFNAGGTGGYREFYQINPGTGRLPATGTGTADGTSAGTLLQDTTRDFIGNGVVIGDVIENSTDGSFGRISSVGATTLTATLYTSGGTVTSFDNNDNYVIYYNHDVQNRRYEFTPVYAGSANVHAAGKHRVRDVCLGYDATCGGTPTDVSLPVTAAPFVTIRDLDVNGIEVAHSSVSTPVGTPTGSIRLTGLDYHLRIADGELPQWFVKNNWHQLLYIAYSEGDSPDGTVACIEGTDCLTVSGTSDPDDKRAIVISAGQETNTTAGVCGVVTASLQDRANGRINAYYESQNCVQGDDIFQDAPFSSTFNDQVRVVDFAP